MALLTKKITQVLYVGTSSLALATLPTAGKSALKFIRQVNPAGTGYGSFNPLSGVNALTTAPGATASLLGQYIVETLSATPNVDLGPAFAFAGPGTAPAAPQDFVLDGTTVLTGETTFDATDQTLVFPVACTLSAAFTSGSGTVQYSTDGGSSWTSVGGSPVPLAANIPIVLQVLHPLNTAFSATLTATFS